MRKKIKINSQNVDTSISIFLVIKAMTPTTFVNTLLTLNKNPWTRDDQKEGRKVSQSLGC